MWIEAGAARRVLRFISKKTADRVDDGLAVVMIVFGGLVMRQPKSVAIFRIHRNIWTSEVLYSLKDFGLGALSRDECNKRFVFDFFLSELYLDDFAAVGCVCVCDRHTVTVTDCYD